MDFPQRPGPRRRRGDSPLRLPRDLGAEAAGEPFADEDVHDEQLEIPDFLDADDRGATRRERSGRERSEGDSETLSRVLWALPAIGAAIAIVVAGGWIFAGAMVALAWIGLSELFRMTAAAHPIQLVAYVAVAAMIVAATLGDSFQMVLVGAAFFPLMLGFAMARRSLDGITVSFALTVFAVIWLGLPFAHAVLLRELEHGAGLVVNVLVATFAADTLAYLGGRAFGERPLAPTISPNKTVEGMVIGVVGGAAAFWIAGLYQDWLGGTDALLMGVCIAALAPLGDLFESAIKRDLDTDDSGGLFGPHGGVLDRLDAVLFTIVAGYYLSLAIVA